MGVEFKVKQNSCQGQLTLFGIIVEVDMIAKRIGTALIVDDNYYNRDLSALALRHVGCEITEAENGQAAITILEQQTFDILILDLAMPEMDGLAVLRRIRDQTKKDRKMWIIVMTANPHMVTDEVDDVSDYILCKPIDINRFADLARRLIDSHLQNSSLS